MPRKRLSNPETSDSNMMGSGGRHPGREHRIKLWRFASAYARGYEFGIVVVQVRRIMTFGNALWQNRESREWVVCRSRLFLAMMRYLERQRGKE